MARNITIGFAGSTPVTKKTLTALLDDYLGFGPVDADGYPAPSDNTIRVIFPASTEHFNDALQTVVDWTEYADLPYEVVLAKGDRDDSLEALVSDADKVHEVVNVDKALIDLLKDAEDEKFLMIAWNDSDDHCEILLDLADTAGVKALDLTAALDDLSFADAAADEPEKATEPEPEPEEKPTRGRRGSRRGAEAAEEPKEEEEKPVRGRRGRKEQPLADSDEVPLTDGDEAAAEPEATPEPEPVKEPEAETPKRRGRARAAAAPVEEEKVPLAKDVKPDVAAEETIKPVEFAVLDRDYLSGALQSIFLHLQAADAASAYRNLSDPQESPVAALAREALEHVSLGAPAAVEEPVEEVKRGRGRPRTNPETTGYLVNGDGVYRKAGRGRPKSGEEKVDLTAEQVEELAEKGLILGEA